MSRIVANADSLGLLQIYWIRICLLKDPPTNLMHSKLWEVSAENTSSPICANPWLLWWACDSAWPMRALHSLAPVFSLEISMWRRSCQAPKYWNLCRNHSAETISFSLGLLAVRVPWDRRCSRPPYETWKWNQHRRRTNQGMGRSWGSRPSPELLGQGLEANSAPGLFSYLIQ